MNSLSVSNPPHMTLVEPAPGWAGIGMGADGKFRIDGSAIKLGYKCSTAAVLRYIWGLTSKAEKAALLAGQAFHKAVEQHLLGGTIDEAMGWFDYVYKDWAQLNVVGDDARSWQATHARTREYLAAHPVDGNRVSGWPFTVTHVEVPFEVPLTVVDGIEVLFLGRMDVVGEYLDGYVVPDFKTTTMMNAMWRDQWSMDSSTTGYVWAARQLLRDKPVMGAFIQGVEWGTPKDPNRKCSKHGVKRRECEAMHPKWELVGLLERNAVMVENWLADAVSMAEGLVRLSMMVGDDMEKLTQLSMEGMFTGECRWCEFRKVVCEVGRRPGVARAGLEFAPWNPLEG